MQDQKRMNKLLGVNIDHLATLRQARFTPYPDVLEAGLIAEAAGADSITVHLREDRRHIQPNDVIQLKQKLHIPLNLEMAASAEMVEFALQVKPTYCCLVPERREELTTEGGLNVVAQEDRLKSVVHRLSQAGIVVSLFIDPDSSQLEVANKTGVSVIELHTGDYANASKAAEITHELMRLQKAAEFAAALGLQVNAGHGLHYENTQAIVAIPQVQELNIGHAIIAKAVFVGLANAVKAMANIVHQH